MAVGVLNQGQQTGLVQGSFLGRLVTVALMFLPLLGLATPTEFPMEARSLAAITWVLCTLPTFLYVSSPVERRRPIPTIAAFGLIYAFFFTFHIVVGVHVDWPVYYTLSATSDFGRAVEYVTVGGMAVLVGYTITTFFWTIPPPWSKRVIWVMPRLKYAAFIMLFGTIPLNLLGSLFGRGAILSNLLALGSRLEFFGSALLVALSFRGKMTARENKLLWSGIGLQAVIALATGSVANLALRLLIVGISAWVGGARITMRRVLACVFAVMMLVVFRGLVHEYREQAWFGRRQLSMPAKVALWSTIVTRHIMTEGPIGTLDTSWKAVSGRTNHLALLADVSVKTPSVVPYWNGDTYLSLIGSFVPRALWPNKPEKRLGQDFGHRYGYLTRNDLATSFNLPYLVEFYANFGEIGILVGMLVVGVIFGITDSLFNRPGQPLQETAVGVGLTLPMITHLESDFSLTFGGLVLNGIAAVFVLSATVRYASLDTSSGARRARASPEKEGLAIDANGSAPGLPPAAQN